MSEVLLGLNKTATLPVMHRVVVRVPDKSELIDGTELFATAETQIREQMAAQLGIIVALGPTAFDHAKHSAREIGIEAYWPQVGDQVRFVKYAGIEWEEAGHMYRLLNDEDLIGVIPR